MACRIVNAGKHPLRVDLRDGSVLKIGPGAISRPMREELLYGNGHLLEWERRGLARRVLAHMEDVIQTELEERLKQVEQRERDKVQELERVQGVGPRLARVLISMGITGIAKLAQPKREEESKQGTNSSQEPGARSGESTEGD